MLYKIGKNLFHLKMETLPISKTPYTSRFWVFKAIKIHIVIYGTLCMLVDGYNHYGGIFCPESGNILLPDNFLPYTRKLKAHQKGWRLCSSIKQKSEK